MKTGRLKKAIAFFVIISLLIVAYFNGLFIRYNFVTAHYDLLGSNFRIIYYGEPALYGEQEYNIVETLGFKIERAYGCNINRGIVNGINAYNGIMESYIENNICHSWKQKLSESSYKLYQADSTIIDRVEKLNLKSGRSDIPRGTDVYFEIEKRFYDKYKLHGYGYIDSLKMTFQFFEIEIGTADLGTIKIKNTNIALDE